MQVWCFYWEVQKVAPACNRQSLTAGSGCKETANCSLDFSLFFFLVFPSEVKLVEVPGLRQWVQVVHWWCSRLPGKRWSCTREEQKKKNPMQKSAVTSQRKTKTINHVIVIIITSLWSLRCAVLSFPLLLPPSLLVSLLLPCMSLLHRNICTVTFDASTGQTVSGI